MWARGGVESGRRYRFAALAGIVASAGVVMLTGPAAHAAPTNAVFTFTGAAQSFPVPAGVCTVSVTALGAQGGADPTGLAGGLGGSATATLAVTPGESLQVNVGGQGVMGATNTPGAGGFPDGGPAGGPSNAAGGGGGGSSDVRQGGTAVSNRVVVAGGGGGSAFGFAGSGGSKAGGGGGGSTGQAGADKTGVPGSGGQGGTQIPPGGAGGTGNTSTDGGNGTQPNGGTGGNSLLGGAGGGGGFFGGGGGSAAIGATDATGTGGGGGSGFTQNGAGLTQAVRAGDGQVTITFDPTAGGCPPVAPAVAVAPRFTG